MNIIYTVGKGILFVNPYGKNKGPFIPVGLLPEDLQAHLTRIIKEVSESTTEMPIGCVTGPWRTALFGDRVETCNEDMVEELLEQAVKEEREACAKVCEEYAYKELTLRNEVFGKMFANAIRARGER